jgi:hypothetical protein
MHHIHDTDSQGKVLRIYEKFRESSIGYLIEFQPSPRSLMETYEIQLVFFDFLSPAIARENQASDGMSGADCSKSAVAHELCERLSCASRP